jgi:hypothetical protein
MTLYCIVIVILGFVTNVSQYPNNLLLTLLLSLLDIRKLLSRLGLSPL